MRKQDRSKPVVLTEGERLTLRAMLVDKTKWFAAVSRAYGLHPSDDNAAAVAILETLERKL